VEVSSCGGRKLAEFCWLCCCCCCCCCDGDGGGIVDCVVMFVDVGVAGGLLLLLLLVEGVVGVIGDIMSLGPMVFLGGVIGGVAAITSPPFATTGPTTGNGALLISRISRRRSIISGFSSSHPSPSLRGLSGPCRGTFRMDPLFPIRGWSGCGWGWGWGGGSTSSSLISDVCLYHRLNV